MNVKPYETHLDIPHCNGVKQQQPISEPHLTRMIFNANTHKTTR